MANVATSPLWAQERDRAAVERTAAGEVASGQDAALRGRAILLGVVTSQRKNRPVEGARVYFPRLGLEAVTGKKGMFRIDALPAGDQKLLAHYLDFTSDTVGVRLVPGVTTYVRLALQTEPVELPELRVEVSRLLRDHRLVGFYERLALGRGNFITREDLRKRDVVANMRRIPGVRMDQCVAPGVSGMRRSNCWALKISRGVTSNATGALCQPEIWLDGHLVSSFVRDPQGSDMITMLQNLPRHLIEGIEVYRNGTLAPAQYRTYGACGIILIWTQGT